jgi:transposase
MRLARDPSAWGFDRYDGRRLGRAMAGAGDVRLFRRLQAVRLVSEGYGLGEAARLVGAGRRAVYEWVGLYLAAHRPADLADAPRSGRPPAAGAITDARIAREFGRDPLRLGYMATEWTVPLLAGHLSRAYGAGGCGITARTLRRRMRALGLRWKRPRHVFGDKDPNGPQKKGRSTAA